jgi:predicted small lipoprotein YifL
VLSSKTIIVSILAISFTFLTLGCGKKASLHIPTEKQKQQLKKEKLERDAVLKKRQERKNKGTP